MIAYIADVNLQRRNLKNDQHVMAHAILYPEPEKGGRGKKGETLPLRQRLGISERHTYRLLAQARKLFDFEKRDLQPMADPTSPPGKPYPWLGSKRADRPPARQPDQSLKGGDVRRDHVPRSVFSRNELNLRGKDAQE